MDALLSAMAIFIKYPGLAAAIGAGLIGVGVRTRRQVVLAVGVVWILYAIYETGMRLRWLCSGECNIRLDLFLIYPMLLIGLVIAAVSLLRPSQHADHTRPGQ